MGTTIISMFRSICGIVDSIIYLLISRLYDLFTEVANLILYSDAAMEAIGKRIGLILGIVMLFRVAISLISYIISPDEISDKAKGGSKMITNAIVSFILLVTINPIFKEAYKIQVKVVESNFIEKIFFGPKAEITNVDLAYSLYTQFVTPKIEECSEMFDPFVGMTDECATRLQSITNHNTISTITDRAIDEHKFWAIMLDYNTINYRINGDYLFDYFMIVSTIAGGVVALILIVFCMDLAARGVKLLFLQMVAPVFIIANIDPNKGSEMFKKWYKQCFDTYISLFIRLIAINFAVFIITLIRSEFRELFSGKSPFLFVLLVIGCLMFAKQVPKLIEDITGIKSEGFTLNPIKKFEEQALFGKQITGAARGIGKAAVAGTIGAATGAAGAGIASAKLGNKWWENIGAGARGAGRGLISAAGKGAKAKNTFEAVKGSSRWGKEADYVNSLDGTDFAGRVQAWGQQRLHIKTEADKTKENLDNLENLEKVNDAALKRAESESIKYNKLKIKAKFRKTDTNGKYIKDVNGNYVEEEKEITMEDHKQMQEKLTRLRNETVDYEHFIKMNEDKYKVKTEAEWALENNLEPADIDLWRKQYKQYTKTIQQSAQQDFQEYVKEHDAEIQDLNDKININSKKFALEYIDKVNKNDLINNSGEKVTDHEILNYVNQSNHYTKELENHNINVKYKEKPDGTFELDSNGNKQELNMKDVKQMVHEKRQAIESNYNDKGFNEYQRQKANAEATKPSKGN